MWNQLWVGIAPTLAFMLNQNPITSWSSELIFVFCYPLISGTATEYKKEN